MKKLFAAFAVLLAVSTSAFALDDGDISSPVLFTEGVSRADFDADMRSHDALDDVASIVAQALEENGVPIPVTDIDRVDERSSSSDRDYVHIRNFVLSNIPAKARSGSVYLSIALIDFDQDGILYGCVMFAHVNSRKDVKTYSYVFAADAN